MSNETSAECKDYDYNLEGKIIGNHTRITGHGEEGGGYRYIGINQ